MTTRLFISGRNKSHMILFCIVTINQLIFINKKKHKQKFKCEGRIYHFITNTTETTPYVR